MENLPPQLDEKLPDVEIPEGLKPLMSDITREVLRHQPRKLFDFISNYLSALLITREHGIVSVKILDDLCDCKPTLSQHLLEIGLDKSVVEHMSEIIKNEIEQVEPQKGREKVRELTILNKILMKFPLDEKACARVCQIIRNAYKDYWYRKRTLEESIKTTPDEPWEIAAQNTLEIYKKTKPSMMELERATLKIQSAYRAYHTRKELLPHLKQKAKRGPKVQTGPPVDIGESREIELGPLISIKVSKHDDIESKLTAHKQKADIPRLKFISNPNLTPSEMDLELDKASKQKKSVAHAGVEESQASISSPWRSAPRISFIEAPPVVIEDPYKDSIPEEIDMETEDIEDYMSEIPEALSDDEVDLESTATSLMDSLNLSANEDTEEEER